MPTDEQPSVATGVFKQPFKQQVAFFRQKLGNLVPTKRWDDISKSAHDVGFMVAGAQKADLLADIGKSMDKANTQGKSINAFRKDFHAAVKKHNWHGWTGEGSKAGEAWRTRIIYQTNASTAYAAGRYAQLNEGGFKFWVYRHADGVRHPRPQHEALDGISEPPDSGFWDSYYPPNGWLCHCYVVGSRSDNGTRRVGGDPHKPLPSDWNSRNPKTGEPPGIDKGWGYAPGASVSHTVTALATKLPKMPATLGATFWQRAIPAAARKQTETWKPFLDTAIKHRKEPQGKTFILGAISVDTLTSLGKTTPEAMPKTAEVAIRDKDVSHMLRDEKPDNLSADWLANLPSHLEKPDVVLLDLTKRDKYDLLYLFDESETGKKLVIKLNYKIKKDTKNLLRSGKMLSADDIKSIKGFVKGGQYIVLKGKL